ncbi:MAG TPA: hypothetical protein VHZ97_00875 [Pseudonocardiaceae bacterium]|jgi:hypothetical protein|nr:hypothetical protein [Pseudonocardiaceae bacterium]
MWVTGYSYPWDVADDPGFADRVLEIGVDEVAIAASYHSTRAATPFQTNRTSVVADQAGLYRPVSEQVWGARTLRPAPGPWADPAQDKVADAVSIVRDAGLRTALWVVLTHNSALGNENPDRTVRNCFGENYPWALCPAQEDVREYAATLAAEAVGDLRPDTVILESCGQMGAVHQHQHEKTDAVWAPAVAKLLSICCCSACTSAWQRAGLDPDRITELLRDQVHAIMASGDLGVTADGLPEEISAALLRTRQEHTDALRAAVLAEVGSAGRVLLHASADPWATGALPGLTSVTANDIDAVVLPGWQVGPAAIDAVRSTRAAMPSSVDVGSYVTAVAPIPVTDIEGYVRDLHAAGAGELHMYHLGLAGPARLPYLRDAVAAAHTPPCAPSAVPAAPFGVANGHAIASIPNAVSSTGSLI